MPYTTLQRKVKAKRHIERLNLNYLPMGQDRVWLQDNPSNPVHFFKPAQRDSWLNTFYCNDTKLIRTAWRIARRLRLVA